MKSFGISEKEEKWFDTIYEKSEPYLIDVQDFLSQRTLSILNGGKNDRFNAFKLAYDLIGDIEDKVILDYGCGSGSLGVFLALRGAKEVYGFDICKEAIQAANTLARINGVEYKTFFDQMTAPHLYKYDSFKFDLVVGKEILHHIIKYNGFECELSRVLKKGARAIFFNEPLGHNPFIEIMRKTIIYRKRAFNAGERVLTYKDINRVREYFTVTNIYELNLLFQIKRFFRGKYHNKLVRFFLRGCLKMDNVLLNTFPSLKKYCGEVVLEFVK